MENSYRIHTSIGSDTIVNVNLQQDVDFFEILSLKISQEDTYRLDNSNYGVIIGRVLANDAFGIPNARLSVFISLTDEDAENNSLMNLYNYRSVNDKNSKNIRYNLLPDSSTDECYRVVGTMPNKRLVLDENSVLEVFDKYYKYTTVTNNAGDYMIYGVPTGNTMLHVDIDLSDCGVLSQKPRDFMYKGYNETQFDNANQFKESTNLDNLSQIITQNQGVYVYSFFGEEGAEDVAITRCDIQIQYKFEPTCVFFGSIFSDSYGNNIGPTCTPSKYNGRNSELVCGNGTIEMIRKTIDGLTEEYQIQGNQLIDSDGVWCYQIPMNLDYVGTDEYGNICATDNPNKGIPTRTRVRFRFSMDDNESDSFSRHRAKYLVPNNPKIIPNSNMPKIANCAEYDKHYLFGSSTLEEDYRDLFWNKVYSVKNYIPRFQQSSRQKTYNHSGLRTANKYESKNPIPYNKARFSIPFPYMLLCVIIKIVVWVIYLLNRILSRIAQFFYKLADIKIATLKPFSSFKKFAPTCISFGAGLTDSSDNSMAYYPGCLDNTMKESSCPDDMKGCKKSNDINDLFDVVEQALAQSYDIIHLDFYNDWLNGSLYFPLWHWKKTKKKSYFFGLFRKRAKNQFCDCDKIYHRLRLLDSCTLKYNGTLNENGEYWHKNNSQITFAWGIIKNILNNSGLNLYYYSAGNIIDKKPTENSDDGKPFARLFSTDIILLGTFNNCDLDGVPQPYQNLPSTTANLVGISRTILSNNEDEEDENATEGTTEESGDIEITGMDWLHRPNKTTPKYKNGLFFGIDCTDIYSKPKTCINVSRISELGVNVDMEYKENYSQNGLINEDQIMADGLITKVELDDYETRAMFATLNHNGLDKNRIDEKTGYITYDFRYTYPVDFDGRNHANILKAYNIPYNDIKDIDYLTFKYGPDFEFDKNGERTDEERKRIIHNYSIDDPFSQNYYEYFPLFNNSFYFYFGINEGKTAIDKFRQKFTSKCFSNNKLPFVIDISKEAAKWCISDGTNSDDCEDLIVPSRCGVIEVNLPDIKKPYSYKLVYEDSNEQIISETNVSLDRIFFGVAKEDKKYVSTKEKPENMNDYYLSDNGLYYKKDGLFHYVKKDDFIVRINEDDVEELVYVENTMYRLYLTDANNKSQSVSFVLVQNPISMSIKSSDLGTKYIPYEDLENDIHSYKCEIYELENYGTIDINSLNIDGDEFKIVSIDSYERNMTQYGLFDVFILTVTQVDDENTTYQVELRISIKQLLFENDHNNDALPPSIFEIGCGGELSGDVVELQEECDVDKPQTFYFDEDGLHFKVWVPGKYEFKVTQYCCGELNDNSSISIITIDNGELFDATINDVPISFLNTSNKFEFWADVNKEYFGCPTDELERGEVYYFPSVSDNQNVWDNYIDYYPLYDEDSKFCNAQTKLNALIFKFESIFNLANSVYFTDSGNNTFEFETTGGKDVLKQAFYPSYNEFENISIYFNKDNTVDYDKSALNMYVLSDVTTVSCDESHPNVVSANYSAFNPKINGKPPYVKILGYGIYNADFNPLFADANLDIAANNYFAAFTHKGETSKYEKIPDIKQNIPIVKPSTFDNRLMSSFNLKTEYYDKYLKNWFNIRFVDRRLGYKTVIFPTTKSKILLNDIDSSLLEGRVVLQTTGGIELAYKLNDESLSGTYETVEYNIIQKISGDVTLELEYYYRQEDLVCGPGDVKTILNECYDENQQTLTRKYFYKADMSFDYMNYDIRRGLYNSSYSGSNEDFFIDSTWGFENNMVLNHTYDTKYSNGYFSNENMTPKRFIDLNYVPLNNVFRLNLSSCSYQINIETEYPIDIDTSIYDFDTDDYLQETTLIGTTREGENIDFNVYCNDVYVIGDSNLGVYADTGNYNVLVTGSLDNCKPTYLRLEAYFGKDYLNENMDYTVYRPFIFPFDDTEHLIEILQDLKMMKKNEEYDEELLDELEEQRMYIPTENSGDLSDNRKEYNVFKTNDNPFDTYEYFLWLVSKDIPNFNLFKVTNPYFMEIYESEETKGTVKKVDMATKNPYDYKYLCSQDTDEMIFRNGNDNIFSKIFAYINGNSFESKYYWHYMNDPCYGNKNAYKIKHNYLMLFGGREYFDSTNLLLERNIKLFDTNNIYQFTPFSISGCSSVSVEEDLYGTSNNSKPTESVDTEQDTEETNNEQEVEVIGGADEIAKHVTVNFTLSPEFVIKDGDDVVAAAVWHSLIEEDFFDNITMKKVDTTCECENNGNEITIKFGLTTDECDYMETNYWHLQTFIVNDNGLVYGISFKIKGLDSNDFEIVW